MAFAVPLAIASAVVSAGGAVLGGMATANAKNYQAAVARNNALIAERSATRALQAGVAQADATSLKGAAVAGRIKAGQAAQGVDVNTGSAVDVQVGQRMQEKLDTETVMNNAMLSAYGYRVQAGAQTAQAELDEAAADFAPIAAGFKAGAGLLGAASSVAGKWGTDGGTKPDVIYPADDTV